MQAMGKGCPTLNRGSASAVDFNVREPSDRPIANMLFAASVEEKAMDVSQTPLAVDLCMTWTPVPSVHAYRVLPKPTASVWQAGEYARTEQ